MARRARVGIVVVMVAVCAVAGAVLTRSIRPDDEPTDEEIVEDIGPERLATYKKGQEIQRMLRASKGLDVNSATSKYYGQRVTFWAISNHFENDLIITKDISNADVYLRVINPEGKDLRHRSIIVVVIVTGKVLAIYPKNKLVILEVAEKDWEVQESM